MLVSLTVGKVDAGVAVLLTQDKRLIEFPSILLPSTIISGSIVDIEVKQNLGAEQKSQAAFASLQSHVLDTYGLNVPETPVLRLRNATQTSLVLEWDPIQLATTTLRSLALYRNGSKAGNIPRPLETLSTKMSGLQIDNEYSFYLVLKTSGGVYTSNTLTVKTHTMNNLTGITVTPGILPAPLRESLESAVERIGAKLNDNIRIDTTHFVCTEGRGRDWEKANEMNIPIVRPEWIEGCEREGKLIGVRGYYLDADPKQRQVGSNPALAQGHTSTTTAPQQGNIPQRLKEPMPQSPDRESSVGGEPGPEVPPTPEPQKDLPPTPADDDDEEAEEATAEDDNVEHEPENGHTTGSKGKGRAEDGQQNEEDEDEEEDDEPEPRPPHKGADMEDVAL